MNQNSSKREADGFSIFNLNDLLVNIKSNEDENFTLMHYLVRIIKTKVIAFDCCLKEFLSINFTILLHYCDFKCPELLNINEQICGDSSMLTSFK